jgi:hypothetical protein
MSRSNCARLPFGQLGPAACIRSRSARRFRFRNWRVWMTQCVETQTSSCWIERTPAQVERHPQTQERSGSSAATSHDSLPSGFTRERSPTEISCYSGWTRSVLRRLSCRGGLGLLSALACRARGWWRTSPYFSVRRGAALRKRPSLPAGVLPQHLRENEPRSDTANGHSHAISDTNE